MEVDQENIESLESLTNFEQEKGIENASSSEDEGIFLSHNPNSVSCNSDAESHSKEEFNKEVKSVTQKPEPEFTSEVTQKPKQEFTSEVTQKPLDVIIDASKPQVMVSDDSSDDNDDVSRRVSVGRRKVIVDSDDEDCNVPQLPFVNEPSLMTDEDDDDCDAVANTDMRKRIIKKVNSDSEDESTDLFLRRDSPVHFPGASQPLYKFNSDLFDAELSDEDQPTKNLEDCLSSAKPHGDDRDSDSIKKNKKQVKHRPPSFKEKQKEVIEIHSETQRMVRESHVSLPYHKPKQRTLSEFLNRRKKTLLPKTNKRSSLKMSMRDIATLRLLEEKKKEVEEFYKSDSDQEDPYDMDWTPDNKAQSQETSSSEVLDVGGDTQADMTDNKSILYPGDELPDLSQVTDSTPDMEMSEVSTLGAQETHKESELLPTQVSEELTISGEGPLVESCDNNDESGILSDVPSLYENLARESENDTSAPAESNANFVDGGTLNKKSPSEEDETCVVNAEVKEFGGGEFLPLSAEDSAQISTDVMTDENAKTDTPKLNLLASRLPDLDLSKIIKETPKLSLGGDDDFIDLEETTPKNTSGVNELMDRFVKHSNTKRKPSEKKQVNLSVVSKEKNAEGEEKLVASNVIVTVDAEEDDQPTDTVPGARFVLLKTALQAKIREQRERERIRRVKEKQFLETEQVIQDDNEDLPDEEAELTDQSETEYETESEPEENDIIIKDRKHKKCKYVDDEAEEEEDEDMIDAVEGDNSEDENDNRSEVQQSDSNDTIEMPNIEKNIVLSSDEEEEDNEKLRLHWEESQDVHTHAEATSDITSITHSNTEDLFASHTSKKVCSVDKDTSTISVDSSFELFGSVIPGHQPGGGTRHGTGGHCNESDGDSAFLTPFVKTKSSSCSRTPREHDLSLPVEDSQDLFNTTPANAPTSISPNGLSLHLTPIEDSQYPLQESHKKTDPVSLLRLDFSDIGGSQERDDLIGLCSGQFTGKTRSSPMKALCEDNIDPTQDINELMGLCSGQFASYREEKRSQITKDKGAFSDLVPCQNNPDEHQNAEDELLELCTAKFTTQITQEESSSALDGTDKPESGLAKGLDEDEDTRPAQMIVFSSDEEGMANRQVIVKKRKKRKRIVEFSDDEDAQDAIVFDDEENEIPRTTFSGFKDRQKGGIRADFLENEAELSGSDANSDDEDEDDADSMEEEEGDHEHYDENELRNQVGRAHMKTLLDSDKRQIRLLQEMYLEDGELHGEGRQRQFRWKNVDNDSDDNEKKLQSDDEEGGDEEMEDAEWRKQRFEREKFLNEQRAKQAEHNEAEVFKVGLRPNVRSSSLLTETSTKREPLKTVNPIPVPTTALKSQPTAKNSFCMPSKRGSFLSRDKTTLARIAEFTKDKGTVVGGAKQGGNFVFQHLSAEEVQKMESTKLKRTQSLPTTKRTKLDRSLSMDASNKKSSSIFRYF